MRKLKQATLVITLAMVATLLAAAGLAGQPASAAAPDSERAARAVGCAVGVEPASAITRYEGGVPIGRFAYGFAWGNCTSNEPVTLEICTWFKTWTGSSWVNYTTPTHCATTGGSVQIYLGKTVTVPCSTVGSARIRVYGKTTIRGITTGLSQTKTWFEPDTRPCA